MEWITRKIIWTIVIVIIVLGLAVTIWNAIPTIIKVLAVILIVGGFFKTLSSK